MTITRISPGVWELRTRHDTLIATGDLYTVVNVWAKLRRDGWSDLPYGHLTLTAARQSNAPAGTTADAAPAPPANRSSRPHRAPEQVRDQSESQGDSPHVSADRKVATEVVSPAGLREPAADRTGLVGACLAVF
jgi:hypothetical protein